MAREPKGRKAKARHNQDDPTLEAIRRAEQRDLAEHAVDMAEQATQMVDRPMGNTAPDMTMEKYVTENSTRMVKHPSENSTETAKHATENPTEPAKHAPEISREMPEYAPGISRETPEHATDVSGQVAETIDQTFQEEFASMDEPNVEDALAHDALQTQGMQPPGMHAGIAGFVDSATGYVGAIRGIHGDPQSAHSPITSSDVDHLTAIETGIPDEGSVDAGRITNTMSIADADDITDASGVATTGNNDTDSIAYTGSVDIEAASEELGAQPESTPWIFPKLEIPVIRTRSGIDEARAFFEFTRRFAGPGENTGDQGLKPSNEEEQTVSGQTESEFIQSEAEFQQVESELHDADVHDLESERIEGESWNGDGDLRSEAGDSWSVE